jgi:hypothetical protein
MKATPKFETAVALIRELGLGVLDAQFHPQSFGSWFVLADAEGGRLRVVWDGRDGALIIQEPSLNGLPDDWGDRWIAGDGYSCSPDELREGLLAVTAKRGRP